MSNNNGKTQLDNLAQEGRRIQELVEKIETLHDPASRAMLQECLQAVLGFYGHGLARILEVIEKAGPDGKKVYDALVRDSGVGGLLLIHGLHPVSLETRLMDALEKVRPYMQSHGGNVELLSLENDFAVLRLVGHCKTCPSSTVTLELAVRHAIEEACPDLAGFEVEGAVKNGSDHGAPQFEHVPNTAPEWTRIENTGQLRDGGLMTVHTETEPLLICRIKNQLYAYHDRCPGCNMPLHLGRLHEATLTCGMGHHFDAQHAGVSLDDSMLHLEPVPLLAQDGVVKVALPHVANGTHSHLPETTQR
jgi:Fe-S cluster biogenesis protein NfuA/nitrite reductase/ring-hydroxylating ferredoxin subunit